VVGFRHCHLLSSGFARRVLLALLVVLAVLPPAAPVRAASFTVTMTDDIFTSCNSGEDCSLRGAIDAANGSGPGQHTITVPAGTYLLSFGPLSVTGNLKIVGAGMGTTIVDGQSHQHVFQVDSGGQLDLSGTTIRHGTALGPRGGGIANDGTTTLTSVAVTDNSAHDGGGISNSSGATLTLNSVILSGNASDGSLGGAGLLNRGTATLTNVTVSDNIAETDAGGIRNESATSLTLTNVTLNGNKAGHGGSGGSGGGLFSRSAAQLTNVTFANNSALDDGGGIFTQGSSLTLTNVTLSGNSAAGDGNDILVGGGIGATNTIVASTPAAKACSIGGPLISLGGNLDRGTSCGFSDASDKNSTDPLLGALGNYGGLTQTFRLLPGSPAIDGGVATGCPGTDQRGVIRPKDGDGNGSTICDIGAFEETLPTTLTVGSNQQSYTENAGPVPMDTTLSLADTGVTLTGATVTISTNYAN